VGTEQIDGLIFNAGTIAADKLAQGQLMQGQLMQGQVAEIPLLRGRSTKGNLHMDK
jgi:hypothetical protein